jgi:hypothetical protein
VGFKGEWGSEEHTLKMCFDIIKLAVRNHGIRLKITPHINRTVKYLFARHGIERKEIYNHLFTVFWEREKHLKWDPSKSPFQVYVTLFVHYELKSLRRLLDNGLKKERTIPLSQLEYDNTIDRSGMSTSRYESDGIDGLINAVSPEDELIGRELMQIADDFFGHHDLAVLLGARDRCDEARRLGIDYFSYCKRLNRKVERFRSYLEDIGYTD